MTEQLTLTINNDGLYDLSDPSSDKATRLKSCFLVQFLSKQLDERGSAIADAVLSSKIRTNADVVSLTALTSTKIIALINSVPLDLKGTFATLDAFNLSEPGNISVTMTVFAQDTDVELSMTLSEI